MVPGVSKNGKRFTRIVPSEAYRVWLKSAMPQLLILKMKMVCIPIAMPVNAAALFYRDALTGDAVGYYQGLADALEEAGILIDDKFIVQWDGSRLLKDRENPRIELTITTLDTEQFPIFP